ncbi:MAG: pirin family protein, partial [Minisyncoccia bacterium]
MKTILHKASSRGIAEHGWLHSRFSFSFAEWYEPTRMGFGVLRVINDDVIDAHSGFGKHPHRDMEIITIVTEGAVSHEDNMGNIYEVPAGDVQVMSAGTGVLHAEFNKGDTTLKLFQIWITPREKHLAPRYDQRSFGVVKKNEVELLVSGDLNTDALYINQDAYISRVFIEVGNSVQYSLYNSKNGAYIFVIRGRIHVADYDIGDRDALGVWNTE